MFTSLEFAGGFAAWALVFHLRARVCALAQSRREIPGQLETECACKPACLLRARTPGQTGTTRKDQARTRAGHRRAIVPSQDRARAQARASARVVNLTAKGDSERQRCTSNASR